MENIVNYAILTTLAYAIVLLRTIARRLKHENYRPDDYAMLIALVFYTITTASYSIILNNGTILLGTDPKSLSPAQVQQIILGSKWSKVGLTFLTAYIWTAKACILGYFTRLELDNYALQAVKFTASLLGLTFAICIITLFEECYPLNRAWKVIPDTPQCARASWGLGVMSLSDILSSLLMIAIPVPKIVASFTTMSGQTKLEVGAIYVLATFICVIPMIRLGIAYDDLTDAGLSIWSQLELFFITVVANAPIIARLHSHAIKHIRHRRYRSDSCGPTDNDSTYPSIANDISGGKKPEGRARKTWRRISGRGNRPPDIDTIVQEIELVQTRKTGTMEEMLTPVTPGAVEAEKKFDIFTGDTSAQLPLARIKTGASASKVETPTREVKLFSGHVKTAKPRKSVIPEVT